MKIIKNIVAVIAILSFASYAQARDQIKIVGSSTVYPYATVVAEKFGKQGSFKTVSYTHLTLPTKRIV